MAAHFDAAQPKAERRPASPAYQVIRAIGYGLLALFAVIMCSASLCRGRTGFGVDSSSPGIVPFLRG